MQKRASPHSVWVMYSCRMPWSPRQRPLGLRPKYEAVVVSQGESFGGTIIVPVELAGAVNPGLSESLALK
jgi:hypothetical protein